MVDLMSYDDYKAYVRDWIARQPKNGYGQYRKISEVLGVSTVFTSQVFRGDRDLQPEHAGPLSRYFDHLENEEKYFLNLIYLARAGSADLRALHLKQAQEIRQQSRALKAKIKNEIELSPDVLARFHSGWMYSAVRLLTDIPGHHKSAVIAEKLSLDIADVQAILQFLVEHGLCIKKNDEYHMGPKQTHLPAESPLIKTRQISWRAKGFEKMGWPNDKNMFFTAPMSISREAQEQILAILKKAVVESTKVAAASKSEVLTCLNVDWFSVS